MSARPITVTLSASFGAGGGTVGPKLAERLGVPFHNRAIPATVSAELGVDLDSVLPHDGRTQTGLARLLSAAARVPSATMSGAEAYLIDPRQVDEKLVADQTAAIVRAVADGDGGVILGRASAVILAGHPRTFHVRLDGPVDARIRRAAKLGGLTEQKARDMQVRVDKAREAYVKKLYGKDARDGRLYHVTLDSTAISWETCVDILFLAADEWINNQPPATV
jgi:cytidylate kinase